MLRTIPIRTVAMGALALTAPACVDDSVNTPPVAVAGFDQRIQLVEGAPGEVVLDGTGSFDPDGDPVEHRWAVLRAPSGLTLLGEARTAREPRVQLTVPGLYVFELVVSDGLDTSAPDHVNVFAAPPEQQQE